MMRDLVEHPDFLELQIPRFQRIKVNLFGAAAIDDVTYRDTSEAAAECALVEGAPFSQTFMTAASPGIVAAAMENRHYASREDYVRALGRALSVEYRFIVEQGCCCRSTRLIWRWSDTRCSPIVPWPNSWSGSTS